MTASIFEYLLPDKNNLMIFKKTCHDLIKSVNHKKENKYYNWRYVFFLFLVNV